MDCDVPDYEMDAAALTMSINSRIHSATGCSPYTAIFGTHRRLTSSPHPARPNFTISKTLIKELDIRLKKIHQAISKSREEVYSKRDEEVDTTQKFSVGELVLLVPTLTPRKHVPTLKGPFRIVSFERSKFVLKPLNGDKE
ncbi:hypothetical protein ADUPG1_002532, partial [Aduncisulcus paluster]